MTRDELIAALSAWGDVELGDAMSGGNRSTVFAARLRGSSVAVRRSRRSEQSLGWELAVMERLRAGGLATPEVVPTHDGRLQADRVCILHFVEGRQPNSTSDWERVAEYLTALHDLGRGTEQRPGFLSARDLLEEDHGGDVNLRAMPAEAVHRCRSAWEPLSSQPVTLIHGDPGASNIVITDTEVVLLDWDEARVDCAWFDLAALPDAVSPLRGEERRLAARAADGWEAAVGWELEPDYARRRLDNLFKA